MQPAKKNEIIKLVPNEDFLFSTLNFGLENGGDINLIVRSNQLAAGGSQKPVKIQSSLNI